MKFKLKGQKVMFYLFIVITLLLLGNIFTLYLMFYVHGIESKLIRLFIKLFNFNLEYNLPTCFSSLLLLVNGILLYLIGCHHRTDDNNFWHWFGLSVIFVFLALDEIIQIHEQLRHPLHKLLNTSGIFYFAWFIPYLLFAVIIGIVYIKFLMRLPRETSRNFIISGSVYLLGAVVLEALSGLHAEKFGEQNLTYAILYTIEELLEIVGMAIFFYALLGYITNKFKSFKIRFQNF